MPVTEPSHGATGWDSWGHAITTVVNSVEDAPARLAALEVGGATVPSDGSVTDAKVAAGAAISADKIVDGTTNKVMTAAERTKLAGVASGATAYTDEQARDALGTALVAGANITITPNDGADTITIAAATTSGIAPTIVDAKGDLIVGTTSDTVARLPVGATTGLVLKTNPGTGTGLEWGTDNTTGTLTPGTGQNSLTGVYYANGYSGVDPTGATSSTSGINTLLGAVPDGATVVFDGTYKITGALTQPADHVRVVGHGEATTWSYQPASAGTMMTITNAQRIKFLDMKFLLAASTAGAGSTLFKISNSFRGSFTRCVWQGQHNTLGDTYARTTGHIGVYLTDNSGDWQFIDCDFNNLGVGIQTDCVENSILGGAFSSCYVGVYGHGAAGQSGMSITGYVDFVSFDDEPGMVARNIWVPDTASDWWISHCWFEGGDVGIEMGDGAGTGPALVSIKSCHVATNTTGIKILGGQGTSVEDVDFGYSNGNTSARSLQINATFAPSGFAKNLRSLIPADPAMSGGNGVDLVSTTFPAGWTYIGTSRHRLASQLIGATDWVTDSGTKRVGVLSSGALVVDGSTAGVVLRDSANKYWRVTVSTGGALTVTGLTTTRPTT